MDDQGLRIEGTEQPRRGAKSGIRRDRGSRRTIPAAVAAAIVVLGAVAGVAIFRSGSESPDAPPRSDDAEATSVANVDSPTGVPESTRAASNVAAAPTETVVPDDGRLLWQSPTAGAPISLAGVPAGTQVILHLRCAALFDHPDAERAVASFGPWGEQMRARLEGLLGRPLADIDSLLVAVTTAADDRLLVAIRASRADAWKLAEAPAAPPGWNVFAAPTSSTDDEARTLIACHAELTEELQGQTSPPPLAADLQRLVATSDADRAVTLIVQPRFLQASGGDLLAAEAAPLRSALRQLTDDRAAAAALSLHWDDDFFAELRAAPVRSSPPQVYAVELERRLAVAANPIEARLARSPWHPYGRAVVFRLPAMLRAMARYVRHGVDDGQAVLRCYLPAAAGQNLALATELLLTLPQGEATLDVGAGSEADSAAGEPASIDERLQTVTSLSFGKDSLQRALELLAADTGLVIEILGADLQLEGITKNQSLGIDLRDRPAGEILLEILLGANPDRTAAGPADPKQKLVYAIRPAADGGAGRIVVTTRAAAANRGERLPAVFGD